MSLNRPSKKQSQHTLHVTNFCRAVDHAARERYHEQSDFRRVIAALAALPLDRDADRAVIDRIEGWAITEGRRLEEEEALRERPSFDGMVKRFFRTIGPTHLARIVEQLNESD